MPHLLPPDPVFTDTGAEKLVWAALRDTLPDNAYLIHGQRLTTETRETEIDLLVLWPGQGTAVIEVKGGLVQVTEGRWTQSDRAGAHVLDPSPIEQAQTAKHQLITWAKPRLSHGLGHAVHLVALPWADLPAGWDVPDAPRHLMLDQGDLAHVADRVASALQRAQSFHPPLGDLGATTIVTQLRRTERAVLNAQALSRSLLDESDGRTRAQHGVLSLLRWQDRAQIVGGAGSGKTHLALMKARQLAADGRRTALLCYSRGLGRLFQLQTASGPAHERPAYVGLYHDLATSFGAERPDGMKDPEYYENHLPAELVRLAEEAPTDQLFDAVVVDEAQDFGASWWDGVVAVLRQGHDGILYVFTDAHQRIFDRSGNAPIALDPFALGQNLRSTRNIAETFATLTPFAQEPIIDPGVPVRFVDVDPSDVVDRAEDAVEALLGEGWDQGDIALLTTHHRHPVQKDTIEHYGYDGYWDEFFSNEAVFYSHVRSAKGLERPVVVLAVDGVHDEDPQLGASLLYVGMSRARMLLVVVSPRERIGAYGGHEVLAALDDGQAWAP